METYVFNREDETNFITSARGKNPTCSCQSVPKTISMPRSIGYILGGRSCASIHPSFRLEPILYVHMRSILQKGFGILLMGECGAVNRKPTFWYLNTVNYDGIVNISRASCRNGKEPHCFTEDTVQVWAISIDIFLCYRIAVFLYEVMLLLDQLGRGRYVCGM